MLLNLFHGVERFAGGGHLNHDPSSTELGAERIGEDVDREHMAELAEGGADHGDGGLGRNVVQHEGPVKLLFEQSMHLLVAAAAAAVVAVAVAVAAVVGCGIAGR
jgi:hypothetical protein